VVKRISGVTIIGDRFVMVRGLADRYNTVLLNGVTAPSLSPIAGPSKLTCCPAVPWTA
jgi:hypothetical protein